MSAEYSRAEGGFAGTLKLAPGITDTEVAGNPDVRCHRQVEMGHGRIETRETFVTAAPKEMVATGAWVGLASPEYAATRRPTIST